MKTMLRHSLLLTMLCAFAGAAAAEVATVIHTPVGLAFTPNVGHEGMTLTMTGPNGIDHSASFGPADRAELSIVDQAGNTHPDGTYTWRLSVAPQLDDRLRARLDAVAGNGSAVTDMSGVALAAIQALNDRVRQKEQENAELEDRLARLEAAIERLADP